MVSCLWPGQSKQKQKQNYIVYICMCMYLIPQLSSKKFHKANLIQIMHAETYILHIYVQIERYVHMYIYISRRSAVYAQIKNFALFRRRNGMEKNYQKFQFQNPKPKLNLKFSPGQPGISVCMYMCMCLYVCMYVCKTWEEKNSG